MTSLSHFVYTCADFFEKIIYIYIMNNMHIYIFPSLLLFFGRLTGLPAVSSPSKRKRKERKERKERRRNSVVGNKDKREGLHIHNKRSRELHRQVTVCSLQHACPVLRSDGSVSRKVGLFLLSI